MSLGIVKHQSRHVLGISHLRVISGRVDNVGRDVLQKRHSGLIQGLDAPILLDAVLGDTCHSGSFHRRRQLHDHGTVEHQVTEHVVADSRNLNTTPDQLLDGLYHTSSQTNQGGSLGTLHGTDQLLIGQTPGHEFIEGLGASRSRIQTRILVVFLDSSHSIGVSRAGFHIGSRQVRTHLHELGHQLLQIGDCMTDSHTLFAQVLPRVVSVHCVNGGSVHQFVNQGLRRTIGHKHCLAIRVSPSPNLAFQQSLSIGL